MVFTVTAAEFTCAALLSIGMTTVASSDNDEYAMGILQLRNENSEGASENSAKGSVKPNTGMEIFRYSSLISVRSEKHNPPKPPEPDPSRSANTGILDNRSHSILKGKKHYF